MQRYGLLLAVLISALAGGCTSPADEPPPLDLPPAGAATADAAYPPPGATWTERVTTSGLFHATVEDRAVTVTNVDFNGRPRYGLVGPSTTVVLDPATYNQVATIEGGTVVTTDLPNSGRFSWPLWVGKSWVATVNHTDRQYGAAWGPARSAGRVVAFEDVTVPAGTFKAFRIEYDGAIGSLSLIHI